jgi:4-hydroxy-4-methyl-2-oxoglutarate aldolase
MIHIIKSIPIVDKQLIDAFSSQASATVHEAMGKRGALNASIKPIAKGMKTCGRAFTVKCHAADNLMLIKAVNMAQAGDVIIADMGRIENAGPFGEVLAVECIVKGLAGLVVTGSVRDSEAITKLGFPVFASNLSICGTAKATLGTINHPISCGDEIVNPGDIILGDDDGVVVIPRNEAEDILMKAEGRVAKEDKIMKRLREGESLFDIYGYQAILNNLGCVEE